MNTWKQVESMLAGWNSGGMSKPDKCVNLANACIGWSYVFGARGEYCTPANRKSYINSNQSNHPAEAAEIKKKCQVTNGSSGSCIGCQWYPGGSTLFYDCRGFTYWVLLKAAGITIVGGGATSQYNTNANWSEKGLISNMPRDKVCCVFSYSSKTGKYEHTLLYDGAGHYIHCSGTVQKVDMSKYKNATHYAIPKGLYDTPTPTPTPQPGYALVTGKQVAMRLGPTISAGIIMRIATGKQVKIETPDPDWQYVSYNGKSGYMMKRYISINGEYATVTGKKVALRVGPTTDASVICRIETGKTVKVCTPPSDWECVSYNNKKGYMMKQYIKEG